MEKRDGILESEVTTTYKVYCPCCEKCLAEWDDEMKSDEVDCTDCNIKVEFSNEY